MKKLIALLMVISALSASITFASCGGGNTTDSDSSQDSSVSDSSENGSSSESTASSESSETSNSNESTNDNVSGDEQTVCDVVDQNTWASVFDNSVLYNVTATASQVMTDITYENGVETAKTATMQGTEMNAYEADSNGNIVGASYYTQGGTGYDGVETEKESEYTEVVYNSETSLYEYYNVYRQEDENDDNVWKLSSSETSADGFSFSPSFISLSSIASQYEAYTYSENGYTYSESNYNSDGSLSNTTTIVLYIRDGKLVDYSYEYTRYYTDSAYISAFVITFSDYGSTVVTIPNEVKALYSDN